MTGLDGEAQAVRRRNHRRNRRQGPGPSWFFALFLCLLLGRLDTASAAFAIPGGVVNFGVGAVAGGAGAFCSYPLDFVKSQLQTASGRGKYQSGMECFQHIVTDQGPLALFRGVGVQVTGVAPEKALKLGVNDAVLHAFRASTMSVPVYGELIAGATAGFCQVVVTNPTEVLKVGLQTSNMTVPELLESIGGLGGLYRGAPSCILRDITFSLLLFPLHSHFYEVLTTYFHSPDNFWLDVAAACLAAAPAAFFATPPDFIKTRIQSQDECEQLALVPECDVDVNMDSLVLLQKEQNPFALMFQIAQTEGIPVLFSGALERVVRSVPQFGVTLALYDVLKRMAVEHHLLS